MTATAPAALSVADAAKYLGISRSSMYRLTAECGTRVNLRPVHIGGRRVFRIVDLDRYLEANLAGPLSQSA